jgi:hypothetical protein
MAGLNVTITNCNVTWPLTPGATGYEIHVNDKLFVKLGPTAMHRIVPLKQGQTKIEVFALGIGGEMLASGSVSWNN